MKEDVDLEGNEDDKIAVEGERQFPDAFYCPLSKRVIKDPVVDEGGDSYERTFVTARDDSIAYYPNRALKTIIEDAVTRQSEEGSVRDVLRRWDESVRSGWQSLVEQSAFPSNPYRPLPESYYCPITCDLINQPVIDPEGNTYEKLAVENWIHANGKSPLTRNTLTMEDLRPNIALQALIDEEKEKSDESIHPSIRRWKESAATESPEEPRGENAGQPTSPPAQTYPTTHAEIQANRRCLHREETVLIVQLIVTIVVFIVTVPFLGIWSALFIAIYLLKACVGDTD